MEKPPGRTRRQRPVRKAHSPWPWIGAGAAAAAVGVVLVVLLSGRGGPEAPPPPAAVLPVSVFAADAGGAPLVLVLLASKPAAVWCAGAWAPISGLGRRLGAAEPSGAAVRIRAEGAVPFGDVDRAMAECRAAGRGGISFAVRKAGGGEGEMNAGPPGEKETAGRAILDAELRRYPLDETTRALFRGMEVGVGPEGLATLAALVEQAVGSDGGPTALDGVLIAGENIPFADVLAAADAFRGAGVEQVRFRAAPPAGTEASRASEPPVAGPPTAAPAPESGPIPPVPAGDPWRKRLLAQKPVRRFGLRVWSAAPDSAREGVIPPASTTAEAAKEEAAAAEILVPRNGEVWCGGDRVTLDELKLRLFVFAEMARDEKHSNQPSRTPVLLTVGGGVRWREVQWIMQVCADPAVRIPRIYWAVAGKDGAEACLPAFLPMDRELRNATTPLPIELKRAQEDTQTRMKLLEAMLGAGEEGFALLAERVKELVNLDPANAVQINAWAWVPFADVVRVVDMVRATGGGEILFVGAPPPSK